MDAVFLAEAEAHIVHTPERFDRVRVVAVCHDQTALRHQLRKFTERMLHVGQVLEKVQMVGVHVQNDRRRRVEIQEGVAVFAAFQNDRIALADPVAGVEQRQIAADHDGRVALRLDENMRQHGGRGGFSVRTGHADRVFVGAHDVAPCLRPFEDRDTGGTRRRDLRIVIVGRRRADHAVCAGDVVGAVSDVDGDAVCGQLLRSHGGVHVRAGDLHPHAAQHQTQRAHGNAADPHQMRPFSGLKILSYIFTAVCSRHEKPSCREIPVAVPNGTVYNPI